MSAPACPRLLALSAVIAAGWIVLLPASARGLPRSRCSSWGERVENLAHHLQGWLRRERRSRWPVHCATPNRCLVGSFVYPERGIPQRRSDQRRRCAGSARNTPPQRGAVLTWSLEQSRLAEFSFEGLLPLARIAGLRAEVEQSVEFSRSPQVATLIVRADHRTQPAHVHPRERHQRSLGQPLRNHRHRCVGRSL